MGKSKYTKALKRKLLNILETGNINNKELCKQMGITETTFYKWMNPKSEYFVEGLFERIESIRTTFLLDKVPLIENSLLRKALGYEVTETTTTIINGKERVSKKTRHISPNTKAIIYLLENLKTLHWQTKPAITSFEEEHKEGLIIQMVSNGEIISSVSNPNNLS